MVHNLRLRLRSAPRCRIMQTSHQPDALLHLRCCYGRRLALVLLARRMAQNGAPTHEIERQGRWKQGGGMVGRYTRGESAGPALRYL